MSEVSSLINLGDLSKPATVLIEKISDAIGGYFKPYQITRIAKAESEAELIKAQAQIEITDLQRRAFVRFISEESKKQYNIEKITQMAIPQLNELSNPNNIDDDWLVNFFDKCRVISDEEMQTLWSKILAGEANTPGSYSKRTVNFLESMDKSDARLFTIFCGFSWYIDEFIPLIFDVNDPIYNFHGINFGNLKHLDDIGLIKFEVSTGFKRVHIKKKILFRYYNDSLYLVFNKKNNNNLSIGHALYTKVGQQLAKICGSSPVNGFYEYVIERWINNGLILSSPYPKQRTGTG